MQQARASRPQGKGDDLKWPKLHANIREGLKKVAMDTPTVQEFRARESNEWLDLMPDRKADVVAVTQTMTGMLGPNPWQETFAWDLEPSLNYPRKKDRKAINSAPCFLCHHTNWVSSRCRPLTGLEQMTMQGFRGINIQGVRDADLRHLSGDTQNLMVIGPILGIALANTREKATHEKCSDQERTELQQSMAASPWVGPSFDKNSGPLDDIMLVAGVEKETRAKRAAASSGPSVAASAEPRVLKRPASTRVLKRPASKRPASAAG